MEMMGGDLDRSTIPLVVDAARAGDSVTLQALEEVGCCLGTASLVNVLDPDLVVLGGSQPGSEVPTAGGEDRIAAARTELDRKPDKNSAAPARV